MMMCWRCSILCVNLLLLLLVAVLPRSITALASNNNNNHHINNNYSFRDSWSIITLGDLHMEDDMTMHNQARQDCLHALRDYPLLGSSGSSGGGNNKPFPLTRDYLQTLQESPAGDLTPNQLHLLLNRATMGELGQSHIVSLGDLGRGNKNSRHEPGDAGTTKCFQMAKQYLDGFAGIPYDLVAGNHDLEALSEFESDHDNLQAWMDCFHKPTPQFHKYIGTKTLLLGLSTVQFREAPYSSHEVYIDDKQLEWFQQMVESHPNEDGWKLLVFSHAPIMGSGLRVLQDVHIKSGCAWLNHCSSNTRNRFIQIVKQNPQIKCWSSGHFHLSHELQNTLVQVGSCTFVQVGVMGPKSTRDGRRQTRFFRGCAEDCIEIYSINHHVRVPTTTASPVDGDNQTDDGGGETKAEVRLDATIDLKTGGLIYAREQETNGDEGSGASTTTTTTTERDQEWFQAYLPQEEDGCYLEDLDGSIGDTSSDKVCWWHMADGKVLGLHQGQVVEYDAETLAPLGVVVTEEQLHNREVLVVQNKTTLALVDDIKQDIEVVHPNADGSYWRKLSRSKVIRLDEQAREEVAKRWMDQNQRHRTEEDDIGKRNADE
mmetsp:Transcript_40249/g.61018  ORF Transcript_40249/g.61018 Transcript_40249/m.61018 type:complete len:599 (+) Transcript_40249:410-2206(+)